MSKAGRIYCSAVEQELTESGHADLGEESGGIFGSLSCPTNSRHQPADPCTKQPLVTVGSTDCTILSQRTLAGQANRAARSRPAQDRAAQAEWCVHDNIIPVGPMYKPDRPPTLKMDSQ
jgi:hypothetical protein